MPVIPIGGQSALIAASVCQSVPGRDRATFPII
jgi:hypothetical protein